MRRCLLVAGTRPEIIKLYPLWRAWRARGGEVCTVFCGQHEKLGVQTLRALGWEPEITLSKTVGETLPDTAGRLLRAIGEAVAAQAPEAVLVQGDTLSAYAGAVAGFLLHVPVGHVEAGLRTGSLAEPFPEEFLRRGMTLAARYHFAPTAKAVAALRSEGVDEGRIFLTGNTVVDAVRLTAQGPCEHPFLARAAPGRRLFFTAHRRENLGKLGALFGAVRRFLEGSAGVEALFPVHPNPEVRRAATAAFCGCKQMQLCEPLDVGVCQRVLGQCDVCLTDSGGLSEECLALGVPVLVMRDVTERTEGVEAGGARVVGTEPEGVVSALKDVFTHTWVRLSMKNAPCPYGDGHAAERICDVLAQA